MLVFEWQVLALREVLWNGQSSSLEMLFLKGTALSRAAKIRNLPAASASWV